MTNGLLSQSLPSLSKPPLEKAEMRHHGDASPATGSVLRVYQAFENIVLLAIEMVPTATSPLWS